MMESKDPAIKLFGMKIRFPVVSVATAAADEEEKSGGDVEDEKSAEEGTSTDKATESAEQGAPESPEEEEEDRQNSWQYSKSKGGDGDGDEVDDDENSKDHQSESINSQENNNSHDHQEKSSRPLKKPTKILPCPRCNSMDTKFCYYNNYNINQPRHFCKACQRYWTAGGTMRNVPIGAGRRKNKNSPSHYRHITISEALQAARIGSTHHPTGLKTSGRVLSFGLEPLQQAPSCDDSMASVLKLGDQKVLNGARNGFHRFGDDSSDNRSTDESRTRKNGRFPEVHMVKNNNMNGFACVPWPYTWNPSIPPPGFFPPPGFAMPFYPYWSIPVLSPQTSSSSSQKGSSSMSGQNSPTLGKHSRDRTEDTTRQRNGSVLVPKTLRMDDPDEAAKSSIWKTLGIKSEVMSRGGGLFEGFAQKGKKTKNNEEPAETSPVLYANPAALSRSIDFHERV